MIIAGVLLTVFNNINQETREDRLIYSEFLEEVRLGRVEAVQLAGINITGTRAKRDKKNNNSIKKDSLFWFFLSLFKNI